MRNECFLRGVCMEQKKVYIVGAHSRGRTVAHYLTYLNPQLHIEAYLVNNDEKNPEMIDGIPVLHLGKEPLLDQKASVYIGTRSVYHEEIKKHLKRVGMQHVIPVDYRVDMDLRNQYLRKYYKETGRKFCKIDEVDADNNVDIRDLSEVIYVAKSAFDSPLNQPYGLKSYEKEIQVGAELTPVRLSTSVLIDNIGENISAKNKQFCELTAMYWMWKNATEDIVGLVHYRRHFILPDDWKQRMLSEQIDVILPVPLFVAPSLEENYKNRHVASDWDYMMEYLKCKDDGTYRVAQKFFAQGLYSPCNMFIMRKDILNELCEWMFPILFAAVENGGQKEDNYLNRYPGFLSERLISFYFDRNKDRFKIAYADKNFLT